jgi:hypothetical protein
MITAASFNFPIKAGFSLSNRNRADPDWRNGNSPGLLVDKMCRPDAYVL